MSLSHSVIKSDPALVEKARGGDEHAFAALYRRYAAYVARVLTRFIRAGVDAELDDMLQETFADAYLGLSRLRDPGGFRPWIRQIAVRCAYDRHASRRRLRSLSQSFESMHPKVSDPRDRDPIDSLDEVLRTLSAGLRTPWILHTIHGETFDEVARRCGISPSTAKRRIGEAQLLVDRRLSSETPS
jgi:RNA polymerase sigma factor (sigma-70 family)